jgi:hypothetical protein
MDPSVNRVKVPCNWVTFISLALAFLTAFYLIMIRLIQDPIVRLAVVLCVGGGVVVMVGLLSLRWYVFDDTGIEVFSFFGDARRMEYDKITSLFYRGNIYGSSPQLDVYHTDGGEVETRTRIDLGTRSRKVLSHLVAHCQVRVFQV